MDEQTWDVALTRLTAQNGGMQVNVPAEIARSLVAAGLNRAVVRVTNEGLLFSPYRGEPLRKRGTESVQLPEGWLAGDGGGA